MRLRQIEVFHAVYTSGSMTNAASSLNVSQPSVSKVLAHAEQQLGFKLFERTRGKLVPTPEAHALFKHASVVYQDLDHLRQVSKNLREAEAGRVRVASTPALGIELLPDAVASFRELHPGIVFEIETLHLDELNSALLESRVDVGLGFEPVRLPGIRQRLLTKGRFVVIAPPDDFLDDVDSVRLADIADCPFIGLNNRGPLGRLLSNYITNNDVELDVVAWTETYHIARALVASGAGIAIVDEITARSAAGGAVRRFALEPRLGFTVSALHLDNAPLSIAAKQFIAHLQESIARFLKASA